MKNKLLKILLKILRRLIFRCPECGSKTEDLGYGEFCKSEICSWMIGR